MLTQASTARVKRFVTAFLRSRYFENHAFGATSDDWINDPARAARCDDAASNGADGSTHAEHIDDMRAIFRIYMRDRKNSAWKPTERFIGAVEEYFDDLECWHDANGTLDQMIG